ncbi:uncharacterized protein LOC122625474 isoform X4 [Drosophila teissieri]|uniref:uncharacterized protein LOC122625474 isoform X4 n=1 Tax=Drosophila teissieri TaxID=7243 RepID=UPI001CB9F7BA|nr:uncharacterized protein LOC122625474 isoform X4 [Drosophila teissieri]
MKRLEERPEKGNMYNSSGSYTSPQNDVLSERAPPSRQLRVTGTRFGSWSSPGSADGLTTPLSGKYNTRRFVEKLFTFFRILRVKDNQKWLIRSLTRSIR